MKSFVFEVPRIKEESVEKFLNKIEEPFFWHEKYRIGDKTIFTIWYEENE